MVSLYQLLWFSLTLKLVQIRSSSEVQDCQNRRIIFTAEPRDIKIKCGAKAVAVFPCQYEGSDVMLHWIINATNYDSQLPSDHHYNDSTHSLSVTNLKQSYNGTTYQCQLQPRTGPPCVYRSTIGRLIFNCKESENQIFLIKTLPHYAVDSQSVETLREISTTFTQIGNVETFYNISYTDIATGEVCDSAVLSSPSCMGGTCSHELDISSSPCPNKTDINVTVSASDYALGFSQIDAENNFIQVYFNKKASSITLKFINQPSESDKHYSMSYGPPNLGCKHLLMQTKGHLSQSNSISVGLKINPEDTIICLRIIVTNGTKTVSLEGVYSMEHSIGGNINSIILTISVIICGLVTLVSVVLVLYITQRRSKTTSVRQPVEEYSRSDNNPLPNDDQDPLEPIDLSTTAYKLLPITKKCMMYKLKVPGFPDFHPGEGFGYCKYRVTKESQIEKIKKHKRIIVMDENDKQIPKYTILGSAIKRHEHEINEHDLYVRVRKSNQILQPDDFFLYCARSKVITTMVFKKIFDIPEKCSESTFLKLKISGYTAEWIRYGYFEFTKPEYITPSQRIIVKKKDGNLVTGPGIRHLIGARGDGSTQIEPPNLEQHPEWASVFVQSNGGNRQLTANTKFLFCAIMDKISVKTQSEVYPVQSQSELEEFGRRYNPVFKAERGFGYFEFTEKEQLKLYKNVIIMDKRGRLYTGAGAKFFYTGCDYGQDEIEGRKRVSPPDLKGTDWRHIFIQSRAKKRVLRAGTKFLYCEYNTEQLLES